MRAFVLDTNTLVYCLRKNPLYDRMEKDHGLDKEDALPMVSVASVAEMHALALKLGWGVPKTKEMNALLARMLVVNISGTNTELIQAYAKIDAFSQGKLKNKPLGMSARNMAKNDLWIAATAHVAQATLITADGDFTHLDGHFVKLASYTFQ